jgi:hypothetical protein
MSAPFITAIICFTIFVGIGMFAGLSKRIHQIAMVVVGVIGVVSFLWSIVPPPRVDVELDDKLAFQISKDLRVQGNFALNIIYVPYTVKTTSNLAGRLMGAARLADWHVFSEAGTYDKPFHGVVIRVRRIATMPIAATALSTTLHNYGIEAETIEGEVKNDKADIDVIAHGYP